jgi:hypothetical protein
MLLEHCVVFHRFTKAPTPKHKNHAQDCGTLVATSVAVSVPGDPAMAFEF